MAGNKMFTGWFITIFIVYLWMYTQFSKVKVLKILVMSKVNKYSRNRAIFLHFYIRNPQISHFGTPRTSCMY